MKNKSFDFGDSEITIREIIASISIIAMMLLIGICISGKISESQMDSNQIYNKAAKIESADLFQYGMETNAGNAFVYGDLKAVDTVSYPEIDGEYMYIEKVKERYEKHTRNVKDKNGNTKTEAYYQWDVENSESKHCEEISFLGVNFSYGKISIPSSKYIDTISGDKEWSWKSDERVKVRYLYYGVDIKYTGTVFADLRDGTIPDKTPFYNGKSIDETIDYLESGNGIVLFWIAWILLTAICVFGFYYLDNKWLE